MISSTLRLDGTPIVSLIWVDRVFRFMAAQSIVANLSHDRAMRNHGLTPRKVGFFIPRHLAQYLVWWQDHTAGRRVYGEAGCSEVPKKH